MGQFASEWVGQFLLELVDHFRRITWVNFVGISILKVRLKKDGYLYLKNKNVGFFGVPYIFGALDIKKSRITIGKDKYLVVDFAKHRSAAALLIIELNFRNKNYRKKYERIK